MIVAIAGNSYKVPVKFLSQPGLRFPLLYQHLFDPVQLKQVLPLSHAGKIGLWHRWIYNRFGYIEYGICYGYGNDVLPSPYNEVL